VVIGVEFIAILVKESSQKVRSFSAAKKCAGFSMGKVVEWRGIHRRSGVVGKPDAFDGVGEDVGEGAGPSEAIRQIGKVEDFRGVLVEASAKERRGGGESASSGRSNQEFLGSEQVMARSKGSERKSCREREGPKVMMGTS
jgi:hypothetical protein